MTNKAGKEFVSFYYKTSPSAASFIEKRDWAKKAVRVILKPIVWVAEEVNSGQ